MKALLLCVALAACADTTAPSTVRPEMILLIGPADTVDGTATWEVMAARVDPPKEWRQWYRETALCLALPGNFGRIKWYVVPMPWAGPWGRTVYGQHGPNQIVIPATHAGEPRVIKHEAAHDILERNGLERESLVHDSRYFYSHCVRG
jgi:hypothetical protein